MSPKKRDLRLDLDLVGPAINPPDGCWVVRSTTEVGCSDPVCSNFKAGLKSCISGDYLKDSNRSDCNIRDGYSKCHHAWVCCEEDTKIDRMSGSTSNKRNKLSNQVAASESADMAGDGSETVVTVAMIFGYALLALAVISMVFYYARQKRRRVEPTSGTFSTNDNVETSTRGTEKMNNAASNRKDPVIS